MSVLQLDNSDNANSLDNSANNFSASNSSAATIDAQSIPLALYIHIPWCVKKCPYCDFNSHELPSISQPSMHDTYSQYVDALLMDAQMQQPLTQARQISSIFIGGGTPSLLPIDQYQRLFAGLRACFDFADDIEITMEANPGTLEHAPFAQYLNVGINRLSIGVQSFAADKLEALGRIHDPKQAITAIKAAREAGFTRVNVDLMHGLPQQSLVEALHDIQLAHDTGATHISWYQLTIEPNTVFYRDQPILPDEDSLADIEQAGQALLQSLGYNNYEVSAWAGRLDTPCRHNINYWQFGDYLAIGAGAHGKVTLSDNKTNVFNQDHLTTTDIYRFSKSRLPKDYVAHQDTSTPILESLALQNEARQSAPKMIDWHPIAEDELVSEFMLNALRLHEGVTWALFEARTGLNDEHIAEQVTKLIAQGLLMDCHDRLQPTKLGLRYLNQILREFL